MNETYLMKRNMYLIFGLLLLTVIFMSGCIQQESIQKEAIEDSDQAVPESNAETQEPVQQVEDKTTSPSQGMGQLCSGEEQCLSFCAIYRGECEKYCQGDTENPICQKILSARSIDQEQPTRQYKNILDERWSRGKCEGNGTVQFVFSPMKPEDTAFIIPLGDMIDGHITPIDHQYHYPINWRMRNPPHEVNIYAPAAGYVVELWEGGADISVFVEHSCDFYSLIGQLSDISPQIRQAVALARENPEKGLRLPVAEGELIGKVGGKSLDYSVFYIGAEPKQFVVPEHYGSEYWKIYTVDPFDYYKEPVKSQLLAKNPRIVPPLGGRIDYDIDGRLVGTWFLEGTGGYKDLTKINDPSYGYAVGHLVFAYFTMDPSSLEISTGYFNGHWGQFAIKGNTPNPKDVNKESGMIKYELVGFGYKVASTGKVWDYDLYAGPIHVVPENEVDGVMLVQMIEDRKIKLEVFPGKTASQVSEFTENAKIYER